MPPLLLPAVAGVLDVARDFLGEATAGPRCC